MTDFDFALIINALARLIAALAKMVTVFRRHRK